jgi:hypothetical protein
MTWLTAITTATPADGSAAGTALALAGIGLGLLIVLGPLALLVGRDARRRGRNGWAWALMFLWQPVIVGAVYFFLRRRPPIGKPT